MISTAPFLTRLLNVDKQLTSPATDGCTYVPRKFQLLIIRLDKGEDDDTDKDANEFWSNELSTNIVLLGMSMMFDYPTITVWIIYVVFLLKFDDKISSWLLSGSSMLKCHPLLLLFLSWSFETHTPINLYAQYIQVIGIILSFP